MGWLNSKTVKKSHLRRVKTSGGVKMVRVKAATVGSVATNKNRKRRK
jgi:hypothetical protein